MGISNHVEQALDIFVPKVPILLDDDHRAISICVVAFGALMVASGILGLIYPNAYYAVGISPTQMMIDSVAQCIMGGGLIITPSVVGLACKRKTWMSKNCLN